MTNPIHVSHRARAAWPFLPTVTRPGRVYQGPTGEMVIIREDGGADPVIQGGAPGGRGIASDPAAAARGAR